VFERPKPYHGPLDRVPRAGANQAAYCKLCTPSKATLAFGHGGVAKMGRVAHLMVKLYNHYDDQKCSIVCVECLSHTRLSAWTHHLRAILCGHKVLALIIQTDLLSSINRFLTPRTDGRSPKRTHDRSREHSKCVTVTVTKSKSVEYRKEKSSFRLRYVPPSPFVSKVVYRVVQLPQ